MFTDEEIKAMDPYGGHSGSFIATVICGGIFGGVALVLGIAYGVAWLFTH